MQRTDQEERQGRIRKITQEILGRVKPEQLSVLQATVVKANEVFTQETAQWRIQQRRGAWDNNSPLPRISLSEVDPASRELLKTLFGESGTPTIETFEIVSQEITARISRPVKTRWPRLNF